VTGARRPAPVQERVDADLRALAALVDDRQPGWTRAALTEPDREARNWALEQLRAAGLVAELDAAGNVIGRLPGSDPSAGAILTGSHTDTVPGGGRFDGMVGFVGALEVARALREAGRTLRHDLVVIDFFGEEPNDFGLSCVGSRALTGQLAAEHLALRDRDGRSYAQALAASGIDPDGIDTARLGPGIDARAFIELHIEQGPVLEQQGSQLGLVTTITGVARFRALFQGRRDHAGTTPMAARQDAGCAAAGTVLAVERIASSAETGRGTIGSVTFTPDAVNVVTERAEVFGELRSPDAQWLRQARSALLDAVGAEAGARGVQLDLEWLPGKAPTAMSPSLVDLCDEAVADLGYRYSRMYSGAEHDAAVMASVCPTVMLFVPSRDGRSHCPQEWTDSDDVVAGIDVLAESILRMDQRLGG